MMHRRARCGFSLQTPRHAGRRLARSAGTFVQAANRPHANLLLLLLPISPLPPQQQRRQLCRPWASEVVGLRPRSGPGRFNWSPPPVRARESPGLLAAPVISPSVLPAAPPAAPSLSLARSLARSPQLSMSGYNRNGVGGPGGRRDEGARGGDDEEEDEEEGVEGEGLAAWERAYADERSWESLQEDESGLLRPIDTKTLQHAQYRRRLLLRTAAAAGDSASAGPRIQRGLIRYLYVVIDFSRVRVLFPSPSLNASIPLHVLLPLCLSDLVLGFIFFY